MIYYFFRISFFLLLSFIHSFIWNERHSLSKRRIFYCCSVAAVVVVVMVMVAVGAAVVFRSRFQVFCCLCRCAEAIICKFYKLESAMGRSGTNKWWIMLGGNRIVCINVCWCVCVCVLLLWKKQMCFFRKLASREIAQVRRPYVHQAARFSHDL